MNYILIVHQDINVKKVKRTKIYIHYNNAHTNHILKWGPRWGDRLYFLVHIHSKICYTVRMSFFEHSSPETLMKNA